VKFFRLVERWFAVICVGATLLGLFCPAVGRPFTGVWIKIYLAGLLFFSGLKMDFRAAWGALRKPGLVLYVTAVMMLALPLVTWGLARLVLPSDLAAGVLIVAAMPAGLACGALADLVGGNAALALVVTLVTSLVCPVVTPWLVSLGYARAASADAAAIWRQMGFLALVLFAPLLAAFAVRRTFPARVARWKDAFTGMATISLALLILGAMSATSAQFMERLRAEPGRVALLFGFMAFFSASRHVAGWFLAPWRPDADRAALSINAAYVNNGLAIVFCAQFFPGDAAALMPAILLEIPMTVAMVPLKALLRRRAKGSTAEGAEGAEQEA
jgi:BASS family bile acid:Na+ symporter